MIELTWIPEALRLLVWVYLALAVAAIYLALTKPKSAMAKGLWTLGAVAVFAALPLSTIYKDRTVNQPVRDAHQEKLKAPMQRFEMRCKSAGERITRTLDNVDGIVWMKWRPKEVNSGDQFKLNDPYGHDCYGDECIKRLLRVTKGAELNPSEAKQYMTGYGFVETTDPTDNQRYRYVGLMKLHPRWTEQAIAREKELTGKGLNPSAYEFTLERQPISQFTARYGITWEDISTHEDREQWIAGGTLKAIDLQTNEVIAERKGYLIDRGQGSTAGFRQPWPLAHDTACPPKKSDQTTWTFAMKVVQPTTQGE